MDDLPTPVRHTAHGNLPESCRISSPSPDAINFVLVMFTWSPLDSSLSFHALTCSTHSSREVAMITRSSAKNSSQGTPTLKSLDKASSTMITRQIWGIWKLRPAYSPETPNLGQNRWCFVPCDLEIWWMTLENNRASLLCCFKLCATFHSHWWIQTGIPVRKRPIWVKFDNF